MTTERPSGRSTHSTPSSPPSHSDPQGVESGATLAFSEISVDGQVRLAVAGELDIASAPELLARLEKLELDGPDTLALDLGGVTFMDVSGMRVLLEAARRARARSASFVIFNPRGCASRVFGLTAVDQQLKIVFDEQRPS